ncbi:LysM peptidoglycan-binding domain-containing protein [Gracilibacillus alcaliphilus]|uniref:LysM peptidoglycan-binding domain-containing protein n=1 Tax=Gracilibacillus alcaliphilus TaxID=1401441 RepID=UPI001EF8218D|nr:LysM peptidoglycan-binding domain-containing protein [Gracilibacillus alcaliphilus]MBM7679812.1 3D (Asp-Asp-Asp) domain-containing protein [Gracilibacillus alcaliphilus]
MVGFVLFAGTAAAEKHYEVQSGDTLYRIAQNYQVDINAVIAANSSISDPTHIVTGQTINIPDATGTPFTVTAYTAGPESTGKEPGDPAYGITASGEVVEEGRTIACPQSLPFGTKIHIPNLDETYVCEDRGSAITNGYLDIYIEDLNKALEFGVQELQAKVWTY